MKKDILEGSIKDASDFIKSKFNLELERSNLTTYSKNQWKEFCTQNNFEKTSEGIYIPKAFKAYIKEDSKFLIPNTFHELFGHGLFCEHSRIGHRLTDMIKYQIDEKDFLYGSIPNYQYDGLMNSNIYNYEGFAVWLEELISENTGNEKLWDKKKSILPKEYLQSYEYMKDYEDKFTALGLIGKMGMPKYYNEQDVLNITKKIYGSDLENIDYILLRGSKKPYSDIDLYVITSLKPDDKYHIWLDISEVNINDFKNNLNLLDLSSTDALMSGDLIYGDKKEFNKIKNEVESAPITSEAINHNFKEINRLNDYPIQTAEMSGRAQSYIRSYSQNGEQLLHGNKPLTLKKIKEIYNYAHHK